MNKQEQGQPRPEVEELEALINGLEWIFGQQNDDGGWSPTIPTGTSDSEGTGHVVFALIQILGIHLDRVEKALLWTEKEFVRPTEKQHVGYWPQHLLRGTPNRAAELLCCYILLRAEELGRPLKKIRRDHLMETAANAVNRYLKENARLSERKNPFWEAHMCSLLVNIGCFDKKLRGMWKEKVESTMGDRSTWLAEVDSAAYGQALLGLLHYREPSRQLARAGIEDLLSRCKKDGKHIYWCPVDNRPGGAVEITRWVLWSLEESWGKQIVKKDLLNDIIEGAICWILGKQDVMGYWRRDDKEIFGPNFCGYGLLVIWKWIQIKSELHREYLVLMMRKILNAQVSVTQFERLRVDHDKLQFDYRRSESRLRRLTFYKLATCTLLVISMLALLYIISWQKLYAFINSYAKELTIIAALIAVFGTVAGVILRIVKSLKSRRKHTSSIT